MVELPSVGDLYTDAYNIVSTGINPQPSVAGDGSRWKALQPGRPGVIVRNIIKWFVPEVGMIEMYINPENIQYSKSKDIKETRTKGGYVAQYWGEELEKLSIRGTTGTSGIEGINVLEDIYRAEQLAFDPYALALASERDMEANDATSFLGDFDDFLTDVASTVGGMTSNALTNGSPIDTRATPTLADLAFSVEMYYSGWVYKGYFKSFSVTESTTKLGMFDYTIDFTATQRRGVRPNYFAWHRSPVHGPSNSDPCFGVPYSYRGLKTQRDAPVRQSQNSGPTAMDVVEWPHRQIADVADNIFGGIF